jgi:putative transposase
MIRTYKYRLYPNHKQRHSLDSHLDLCRELYNAALQERIGSYKATRHSVGRFDQQRQLKEIRQVRPEFQGISFKVLCEVLLRLDKSFQSFFRRVKHGEKPGFPRFKGVRWYNSLSFTNEAYRVVGDRLILGKVGGIKINLHRDLPEIRKTCVIKKICGAWYASIACEITPQPLPQSNQEIGIDVGLKSFATLSDGTVIKNPRWFQSAQARLRVAQRRVSRRKKGSHRRRKAVALTQKIHQYISNQRRDFHHKLSHSLVHKYGFIAVEALNIKKLSRGEFAKDIYDAGWSGFLQMLAYKAESAGRKLIAVNPSGTSQTCICGATVRKKLTDRNHVCINCGLIADRDFVSAQVILQRALNTPLGANVEVINSCVA